MTLVGGLVLLLVIIYLETGFFLGLVLPGGDYLVFTAGLLAGTHFLEVSIFILVQAMTGAAILGDFTGYAKGMWLGIRLFDKEENKFFKKSYLLKSEQFYKKYGMGAFILGRFLPVVRTLVPMLAGALFNFQTKEDQRFMMLDHHLGGVILQQYIDTVDF
jgi:membrane-associated protein